MSLNEVMHNISQYKYPDINKERANESEFIKDLIDASNHARMMLGIISNLVIENNISQKEKDVLMGHMAYLYKLYDSFIYLVCDNRIEISFILFRSLSEIAVRLKYLTIHMSTDLSEKFIKSSLAYDKKRYEEIQKRVTDNSPSTIEQRMLNSVKTRFKEAGYNFDQINFKNDKNWSKDVSQLANDVGLKTEYEFGFRVGSSAVHARWDFLKQYNLEQQNGITCPNLSYASARPHIIESASYLTLQAALSYLEYFPKSDENATLKNFINEGLNWYKKMSQKHEEFLNMKEQSNN